MNEWKTYRLGEITSYISRGITPSYCDTGLTIINQKCIRNGVVDFSQVKYTDPQKKIPSDKILQDRDILINSTGTGTLGRVSIYHQIGQQCTVDSHVTIVRSSKDIDATFLGYNLINQQYNIESLATGSTGQTELPRARLASEIEILLPPLDEQRRIAGILGSLDDKIELNRRINANLEAQAQALFRSWFVDFEPFRDGPFVDSELGKIPQGWKVGTLSEIGDVIGGGTPSKIVPEYYTDNGIAWITPKDLSTNNCKFTSKGETDISELGYKNSSAKLMPRGSVLFSSRAPIGYISIAKNEICTNQGFKSIVPKKAGTCFIYYFLRNNTSKIESMASGSTFKEASGGLMKSLEVIIPSNKILTAFEETIQPLFNMQEHNEDENARLSALRDTLLPKLMAGEIKITAE